MAKPGERVSIIGASSSTEKIHSSPAIKKKCKKISDTFPEFCFSYQLLKGEERPQCVVCYEALVNCSLKQEICTRI
jgi:hypothetical protein